MFIWLITFIAALLGGLWLIQRRLIYFPTNRVAPIAEVLPGWSEVTLSTADGLELAAWYSPPASQSPVIIVFPGNAGNRADRAPLGRRLAAAGFGVMLCDYRGYGANPGHPTEQGLEHDARAAADFVRTYAPDHEVVLFGESLGAAVAVALASEEPPAALVLRSPFTSLGDVAATHYPYLPVRTLLRDRYPTDRRIEDIQAPVLVIAGAVDSIVPPAQSRLVYELASGPKKLVMIEGADHNDYELTAGPALVDEVIRFVTESTTH